MPGDLHHVSQDLDEARTVTMMAQDDRWDVHGWRDHEPMLGTTWATARPRPRELWSYDDG